MLFQPPLPPQYAGLSPEEMDRRIRAHKAAFGKRLVILGHHYQQDEVIQYADFTGDSLKLSQLAGQQNDAEFVLFCGVHFMAESADIICNGGAKESEVSALAQADGAENPCGIPMDIGISAAECGTGVSPVDSPAGRRCHTQSTGETLSSATPRPVPHMPQAAHSGRKEVIVILPDLSAGCSMADMAAIEQLEDAWDNLTSITDAKIIPITYVNSAASIKAFCGRHNGACCTSSNARQVLDWALTQGDKVIFLPDQHLGRNTAFAMGYPLDAMALYDPNATVAAAPRGGREQAGLPIADFQLPIDKARKVESSKSEIGNRKSAINPQSEVTSDKQLRDAKFYLWKGHCSVHGLFTEKHVDDIRAKDPQCKVLVHPECKWEVVQKADLAGSTEYIIRTLDQAPPGTSWAVGTEMHLVNRLAAKYAGVKSIRSLAGMQCLCTTMYRIDQKHMLWALDELAAGRIVNHIRVDDETRHWALVALQRMLDNVPAVPVAAK